MSEPIQTPDWIQSLWNVATEPYLVVDRDGVVQDCNAPAAHLLSVIPRTSLIEAVLDKERLKQTIRSSADEGKTVVVDSVAFSAKGKEPLQSSMSFTPLATGSPKKPVLLLACFNYNAHILETLETTVKQKDERVDKLMNKMETVIHELMEKTLELAEQKSKTETIINGMGEGLLGCDIQGRVVHHNQALFELLNLERKEIGGLAFPELCPAVASAIGYKADSPNLVEKRVEDMTLEKKDLRISVSPIFDDENRSAGFVLIVQDRSLQAELDRMRSDLISIVSHELRSPLTSIKGYVDLMMAGDLGSVPEDMMSYLSIVSANANRLAALIDDMLDLSRIESGKLTMTFGKVDIKYLCDYVYLTMKPQAEQKHLEFSLDVQPGLAVSGDVDRLQQALTNFVSNAIKYTPENQLVKVKAMRENGNIIVSVQDDGIGISLENQKKLFQRFFRVKDEKTRNIGGTGLGLCITESIVEAHEGRIEVDSEEGQGSCFSMIFPVYHS